MPFLGNSLLNAQLVLFAPLEALEQLEFTLGRVERLRIKSGAYPPVLHECEVLGVGKVIFHRARQIGPRQVRQGDVLAHIFLLQ